jgi:hypothetical protein
MLRDMLLKHAVRNRFGEVIYFGGRNEVRKVLLPQHHTVPHSVSDSVTHSAAPDSEIQP